MQEDHRWVLGGIVAFHHRVDGADASGNAVGILREYHKGVVPHPLKLLWIVGVRVYIVRRCITGDRNEYAQSEPESQLPHSFLHCSIFLIFTIVNG